MNTIQIPQILDSESLLEYISELIAQYKELSRSAGSVKGEPKIEFYDKDKKKRSEPEDATPDIVGEPEVETEPATEQEQQLPPLGESQRLPKPGRNLPPLSHVANRRLMPK
ncbi:hypothetical protein SASPL_100920 [Salvia splendens]|uniref:Uncharacterized protein n=1 Tax=Salvia splendens TaxID=180675 RepID=A0A8X8YQ00_SALSN|nr:hypothetical protein SASPL_100920 [Salvia splendens]